MDRRSLSWTTGIAVVALAGAFARVAAQQMVMQTSDTVRIGAGGPILGGPPDKPLVAGTGLILGQAVDAGSKRPISGALVTLSLSGYVPAQVLADAEGRFVFRDLPAGRFNLTATRPGYADGGFGRTRPSGPTQGIELAVDQRQGDVTIPLWKFAAVGGTVLDENGDPLVGAQVRMLRQATVAGKRQLQPAGLDTTDDRGTYRIGSLVPGEYLVVLPMASNSGAPIELLAGPGGDRVAVAFSALGGIAGGGGGGGGGMSFSSVSFDPLAGSVDPATAGLTDDGHVIVYPTTFYPVAGSPTRATLVTVTSGDERMGVDFQVRPVRTAKVSGTLTGPEGPASNLPVTLTPADYEDLVTPIGAPTAMTDGAGRFTFGSVTPGSYVLRVVKSPGASGDMMVTRSVGGATMVTMTRVISADGAPPPLPTDQTMWSELSVPVASSDVTGLSVTLRPAIRTNGTIAFTGGAVKPTSDKLSAISVSLEAADGRTAVAGGSARGRIDPNGTFQTMGVPPGKYIVRVQGAPEGWAFLGAMIGGRDVSIEPMELSSSDIGGIALTFTDHPASFGGMVTTASGAPDPGATVVLFPTENDGWAGHGASPRRIRTARVAKDGSFDIANVPPGQYLAAAVSDAIAADTNPRFLDTLSRTATRVDIADGDKKKQTLKTTNPGGR
jgi:hypothetical protein